MLTEHMKRPPELLDSFDRRRFLLIASSSTSGISLLTPQPIFCRFTNTGGLNQQILRVEPTNTEN